MGWTITVPLTSFDNFDNAIDIAFKMLAESKGITQQRGVAQQQQIAKAQLLTVSESLRCAHHVKVGGYASGYYNEFHIAELNDQISVSVYVK